MENFEGRRSNYYCERKFGRAKLTGLALWGRKEGVWRSGNPEGNKNGV
jgi:hypothetical protein